jgi:hypothetical protein
MKIILHTVCFISVYLILSTPHCRRSRLLALQLNFQFSLDLHLTTLLLLMVIPLWFVLIMTSFFEGSILRMTLISNVSCYYWLDLCSFIVVSTPAGQNKCRVSETYCFKRAKLRKDLQLKVFFVQLLFFYVDCKIFLN